MKLKIFGFGMLVVSHITFAKTVLQKPVVLEGSVTLTEVNKRLAKKGKPLVPLFIRFESTSDVSAAVKPVDEKIAEAGKNIGLELARVSPAGPGENEPDDVTPTCYLGDPHGVTKVITNLAGTEYTEQLNLWGYKYKKETRYDDENQDLDAVKNALKGDADIWNHWKGNNEDVLVAYAEGDGGDDINETVISPCATIRAKNENAIVVEIVRDETGLPRESENAKSYPTIKDFRKDYEYTEACYVGPTKQVEQLLNALVDSANGDGDSFSEISSIKTNARTKEITVVAKITDESGENEESYKFAVCK